MANQKKNNKEITKQEVKEEVKEDRCSFCGRPEAMVDFFIKGKEAIICDRCLERCNEIAEEDDDDDDQEVCNRNTTPQEIKAYLDEYVIGQEEAKIALSVAAYNHYQRVFKRHKLNSIEVKKSNVLLLGPSRSGKTYMVKNLARFLNVLFASADATSFTEAGYIGDDVEDVLLSLLEAADFHEEEAERGIVYIDEIDKIAARRNFSGMRDVCGEGVQQALLKILEGEVIEVSEHHGMHLSDNTIALDTTKILFIVGGVFVGMEREPAPEASAAS